jgi:hypothetical protein
VRIAVRHGFRDPVQAATSGDVVEDLFQECTTRAELVVDRQPRDTRFPATASNEKPSKPFGAPRRALAALMMRLRVMPAAASRSGLLITPTSEAATPRTKRVFRIAPCHGCSGRLANLDSKSIIAC